MLLLQPSTHDIMRDGNLKESRVRLLCSGSICCNRLTGETFLLWYVVAPIIHDAAHAYVLMTNRYHRVSEPV